MTNHFEKNILDRPEILNFLFHPRKESGARMPDYAKNYDIPMPDSIHIGTRVFSASPDKPNILFFHGNGEIAEDYDVIGSVYNEYDLNFIVADYRGYGRSEGTPGVNAMLQDAPHILNFFSSWLKKEGRNETLWVMGRSLGSASAAELAELYPEKIKGIILESGFAHTIPLLQRLGIDTDYLGIEEKHVFSNIEKISRYDGPTLIIHGQYDQIIPLNHGQDLYQASPSKLKKIHVVENADHNTILMMAGRSYFEIIRDYIFQFDG